MKKDIIEKILENAKKENEMFKEKYPLLTKGKDKFYFYVGKGWHSVIHDLCAKIEDLNNKKYKEDPIVVEQIKEKFGELRFYTNRTPVDVEVLISEANNKCSILCEECGDSGERMKINGWFKVLCEKCKNKRISFNEKK